METNQNPTRVTKNDKFVKNRSNLDNEFMNKVPKHVSELVLILKNHSEIRRFTSLGILNLLMQKGEIKGDKRFVRFFWDKFSVVVDGIAREYRYTEPMFLNCFTASFASFASLAQKTIDTFIDKEIKEDISENFNDQSVNEIIKTFENYNPLTKEESAKEE